WIDVHRLDAAVAQALDLAFAGQERGPPERVLEPGAIDPLHVHAGAQLVDGNGPVHQGWIAGRVAGDREGIGHTLPGFSGWAGMGAIRCRLILSPSISREVRGMPHSPEERKRVLARVRRIRGQAEALERALEAGADCAPVLQQIAAIRGAVNGLMSEVMEAHIRETFGQAAGSADQRQERVAEVTALVRSYLK